ncbi:VanZ family protein [Paenibacillus radicis (ex Xue et al. 2023)]|uniref:VanZ family protein n=1 Tax=Paenibacillus radicis (ex Xue et al. 2023) TaxID=2972489 RepID=A0ABT1Y9D0_9BACL|nr:VanZ family protein [Paenibacillus radicis (ex Xue et al. 2023)]MCR8629798.1 VanZ family protein [Paenibacillus radicis (ex Xue et al. 2023)]
MSKSSMWWIIALAWCVMIFCITASPAATSENTSWIVKNLTSAPPAIVNILDFIIRKMAHVSLFGLLALFLFLANQKRKRALAIAWVLTTLYGATDEFHQIFTPGRTPAITDVGIDSFGAIVVLFLFFQIRKSRFFKGNRP